MVFGRMRPKLSPSLDPGEFNAWYWLKAELQAFCAEHGLPVSGAKEDVQRRVRQFLAGEPVAPPKRAAARALPPARLGPDTPIGEGWKLNPRLRAFFESHVGAGFRFNQALRDLFKAPQGRTLGEALDIYRASLAAPPTAIGRQFQFNAHMRDYFASHPQGAREEALALWKRKRGYRGLLPHSDRD